MNDKMSTTPIPIVSSITPVQIISAIGAIVGLLVSNLVIDSSTGKEITNIAAIVVPAAFVIADSIIHAAKARAVGAIETARLTATPGLPATKVTHHTPAK